LELLVKDQKKYIDKFCKFIDLETNIDHKLIHSNSSQVIKKGRKRYLLRNTPFSPIFYLASATHNQLKKYKFYKNHFKNITLFKIISKIVRPKEKKILVEHNLDLFQNEIKNLYKDSNLELEKLTNTKLKEFDYY